MPVGCFGKLPIFADFIRYQGASKEVEAFDLWVQEGIYWSRKRLGSAWESAFESMSPYAYFCSGANRDDALVGVFTPGVDAGGRRFPFSIFTRIPISSLTGNRHLVPLRFEAFTSRALWLSREGWQGRDIRHLNEEVDVLEDYVVSAHGQAEAGYASFLETASGGGFWNGLRATSGTPDRIALVQGLADVLFLVRAMNPVNLNYGVALPLAVPASARVYAATFWLDMAYRILGGSGHKLTSFFWGLSDGDDPSRLFMFFNGPFPKSFSSFMKPDVDEDTVYDLGNLSQGMIERLNEKMPPGLKSVFSAPEETMGRLLQAVEAEYGRSG